MDKFHRRKLRLAQLRRELGELEAKQSTVEAKGVEIERQLRDQDVRNNVETSRKIDLSHHRIWMKQINSWRTGLKW